MSQHVAPQTVCGNCVFATHVHDKQTGCLLNRHEKLKVADHRDLDVTLSDVTFNIKSFLLERVCMTYRPQEWLDIALSDGFDIRENIAIAEAEVYKEIFPRIGYFIRLKTDEDNAIDKLKKTLDSIIKVKNSKPAYVTVITDKVEYNYEIWDLFIQFFGEEPESTRYHITQIQESPEEVVNIVDAAFGHAENGWVMTTSSGEIVNELTATNLHQIMNIDCKKIVLVKPYDDYNGMLFPAYLFKFLNGNGMKMFSDTETDSRQFLDKVEAANKRSQSKEKTIYTNEEFNEYTA